MVPPVGLLRVRVVEAPVVRIVYRGVFDTSSVIVVSINERDEALRVSRAGFSRAGGCSGASPWREKLGSLTEGSREILDGAELVDA